MKLFDAHGDIWYDVMMHSEKGERDIFRKYQLPKFQKGNVSRRSVSDVGRSAL